MFLWAWSNESLMLSGKVILEYKHSMGGYADNPALVNSLTKKNNNQTHTGEPKDKLTHTCKKWVNSGVKRGAKIRADKQKAHPKGSRTGHRQSKELAAGDKM